MRSRGKRLKVHRAIAPTMSGVARKTGVSTVTVSRALKDGASIADGTRERIKNMVEDFG